MDIETSNLLQAIADGRIVGQQAIQTLAKVLLDQRPLVERDPFLAALAKKPARRKLTFAEAEHYSRMGISNPTEEDRAGSF